MVRLIIIKNFWRPRNTTLRSVRRHCCYCCCFLRHEIRTALRRRRRRRCSNIIRNSCRNNNIIGIIIIVIIIISRADILYSQEKLLNVRAFYKCEKSLVDRSRPAEISPRKNIFNGSLTSYTGRFPRLFYQHGPISEFPISSRTTSISGKPVRFFYSIFFSSRIITNTQNQYWKKIFLSHYSRLYVYSVFNFTIFTCYFTAWLLFDRLFNFWEVETVAHSLSYLFYFQLFKKKRAKKKKWFKWKKILRDRRTTYDDGWEILSYIKYKLVVSIRSHYVAVPNLTYVFVLVNKEVSWHFLQIIFSIII